MKDNVPANEDARAEEIMLTILEGVAAGATIVTEETPLIGAGLTACFVLYECFRAALRHRWIKAFNAAVAGGAEIAGGFIGFGASAGARELAREGLILISGEENAPEKSSLRRAFETALGPLKICLPSRWNSSIFCADPQMA